METWDRLYFLGFKKKSRDITLPTKVQLVKAMVFPVVIYGYESWTIKKVERKRIDAFELWCWRRLLRGPWTARRSNQSILKEVNSEYSFEGLKLKLQLATWNKEMTHWKRPWCFERLKAGGEGDAQGGEGWMVSLTQWTWFWTRSRRWWRTGKPGMLQSMAYKKSDTTEQLNNSSLMLCYFFLPSFFPLCFLYLGISMGLSSNLLILSSPRLNLSFSITSEIFIYHVMLQLQYFPCFFFLIIEPIFVDSLFIHVRWVQLCALTPWLCFNSLNIYIIPDLKPFKLIFIAV